MEKTYWAFSEALALAAQFAGARELPSPAVLRQRLASLFEQTGVRAKEAGFSDEDIREAVYAIAAFMDEQLMRSQWSGRTEWMSQPLQLVYFNENTAGEGFFQRLDAFKRMPGKEHLVQVYYLCIALGFLGRYAVRGKEDLSAVEREVGAIAVQRMPTFKTLSPCGLPRDVVMKGSQRMAPFVLVGLSILGGTALIYGFLLLVSSLYANGVASAIEATGPSISNVTSAKAR
jgi:type VI secretion system protein ImpK